MEKLLGKQRRYLAKQAHSLDPVVMIGQKGLTQGLMTMVDQALENHELIKIRFQDYKDQSKEIAQDVAMKCSAHVVKTIGNTAVLYREQKDPEKKKIHLPK